MGVYYSVVYITYPLATASLKSSHLYTARDTLPPSIQQATLVSQVHVHSHINPHNEHITPTLCTEHSLSRPQLIACDVRLDTHSSPRPALTPYYRACLAALCTPHGLCLRVHVFRRCGDGGSGFGVLQYDELGRALCLVGDVRWRCVGGEVK